MNSQLIPCPDGTMADSSIGCVNTPSAVVSPNSSITEIILNAASTAMSLVIVAAVIMLMYGGISYTIAAGDDAKIRKSKRIMLWGVIGFIVALLARLLTKFVLQIVT
jgi:hypothetical protein